MHGLTGEDWKRTLATVRVGWVTIVVDRRRISLRCPVVETLAFRTWPDKELLPGHRTVKPFPCSRK